MTPARHAQYRTGSVTYKPISCPVDLSMEKNLPGVIALLQDIRIATRRRRNEQFLLDFKPVRSVTPAGALVLAAELDRWNKLPGSRRLRDVEVSKWDPEVRRLLGQMGFFELLKVDRFEKPSDSSVEFVKFRTGNKVDGKAIDELRELELEPFVSVPNKHLLYAAVTEAMTNVVHHAYGSSRQPFSGPTNWWLSAARDTDKGEVVVVIYDQGLGIPTTLPKKFGEKLMDIVPEHMMANDARIIQAAHSLSRSITKRDYRGYGLERDVRRYIKDFDGQGTYRVTSGRGQYTHESKRLGSQESVVAIERPLEGTLIEWRFTTK